MSPSRRSPPSLDASTPQPGASTACPKVAEVTAVLDPRTVRLHDGRDAGLAVVGDYAPAQGDRVLAIDGEAETWVIGVIRALRAVEPTPSSSPALSSDATSDQPGPELEARDGTRAAVSPDGSTLTVRDVRGVPLFTYDANRGQARVEATGDLELRAPHGRLELEGARGVRITGPSVELHATDPSFADANSDLTLTPTQTRLQATALEVAAARGQVALADATFAAERLETAVSKARHFAGVVETRAERLVEHARNVFREAEELSQTRAGRLRMVARGTWSVLARRSTLKAEDDLNLLGERIHLA